MDLVLAAVYLVSAVVAAGVGSVAWRRRAGTPAALGLVVAMAGLVWWALADVALSLVSVAGVPWAGPQLVAWMIPGVTVVASGFVLLCAWVADPSWRPSRGLLALLAVEPLLTVVAAATDPWWHLLVAGWQQPDGWRYAWAAGTGFWVHTAYCYAIMSVATVRLLRSARHASPTYRRQVRSLLGAGLVPTVANLVTVFTPLGHTLPDLSAFGFVLTGLVDGYALFRQGLLTVVPVARGLVLDHLADAVVVVDPDGRVLDVNAQGDALVRRLAPGLPASLAGIPALDLLDGRPVPTPLRSGEYTAVVAGVAAFLDVRVDALRDRRGRHLATVYVVRDVTQVHRQRADLAAANARLSRQSARLTEANRQLEEQLATIEGLRAELAEQAVRDELTGLHNRRYLAGALGRDLRAALAARGELCLVLLDLDHFKSVNDTYGHDVGDRLLRATARALAGTLRPTDTLARYGGEEFVVVLPGATLEQAAARAQELRLRCAEVRVPTDLGLLAVTVSIGVASVRQLAGPDEAALVKAADEALYRAKAQGRNRVCLAEVPAEPRAGAPAGHPAGHPAEAPAEAPSEVGAAAGCDRAPGTVTAGS